jgi:hypothetical protein
MSDFSISHDLTPKEAAGMTVNERLYVAGLLDAFEDAIAQQNENELRSISEEVHLSPENIEILVEKYINK